MREELIRLLQEKVGLSQTQAEQAADTVMQYIAAHGSEVLKSVTGGQTNLGGLFGH